MFTARSDPLADVAAFAQSGAHVLVGTPGRLADLVQRAAPTLDLKRLEVLVLDEADRLLDMGFRTHLDAVMQRLPKQRRTGEQGCAEQGWVGGRALHGWPSHGSALLWALLASEEHLHVVSIIP